MCLFSEVLVDDENGFADALERLTLKKATKNEVISVVGWRAEGPSGFSTPRLRGDPSLLLLLFFFSGSVEV